MAASNTISRLGTALKTIDQDLPDMPRPLTRYMGGWKRQNHPYVSGYWQFLIQIPDVLFSEIAGLDKQWVQKWFLSTAEGFTPPSKTLNKGDLPGQGGLGSSYVTGQTLTRTFTTTHREYSKLFILKLVGVWTNVIDSLVGVSPVEGKKWIPESYKGLAAVILTKPIGTGRNTLTMDDIEEIFVFDGVWPENYPSDALNQDIATNDFSILSITWSFDGWPISSEYESVANEVLDLLNTVADGGYQKHLDNLLNAISPSAAATPTIPTTPTA